MSKNPNFKSNDDNDDDNDDNNNDDEDNNDNDDEDNEGNNNADDETLRRGCYVKKRTRHVTRVHLGDMELDIQSRAEISGSEKRASHDVHGCSSFKPFK